MAVPSYVVELQFGADGTYIDVSSYVQDLTISRGISRVMEDYSAGTLSVTFVNNSRVFDPTNTSSPLYDSTNGYTRVQPGGKIRVTANGVRRFTGFVRDWMFAYDEAGYNGVASVSALDALYYFGQATLDSGQGWEVDSTDARIKNIAFLEYLDLTKVAGVQAGQTLLGNDTWTAGQSVLSYIQQVARSEPADLYSNASAVLVMKDRSFTDYQWSNTMRYNFASYPGTAYPVGDLNNGYWSIIGTQPQNLAANGRIRNFGTATAWMGGTVNAVDPAEQFVGFEYRDNANPQRYEFNGSSYVFSAYGLGITDYRLEAFLLDSTGSFIGTAIGTASASSTGTWTQVSATATAAGGVVAGVQFAFGYYGSTAVQLWGDGFIVEPGSAYVNYFDGGYVPVADSATVRNRVAWGGDAYASMSGYVKGTATASSSATILTFADSNSQGASYGNGTGIPFMDLQVVYGSDNLYNKVQIIGTNATATVEDTTSQSKYGLYSYSQTDNLTTSLDRPAQIAADLLASWRLPEYRAQQITVPLEALTSAQQNLVLALELRDVVRVCFQPSATGAIVDKYYQVLGLDANSDPERDHLIIRLASLDQLPIRLDATLLSILDTDTLG